MKVPRFCGGRKRPVSLRNGWHHWPFALAFRASFGYLPLAGKQRTSGSRLPAADRIGRQRKSTPSLAKPSTYPGPRAPVRQGGDDSVSGGDFMQASGTIADTERDLTAALSAPAPARLILRAFRAILMLASLPQSSIPADRQDAILDLIARIRQPVMLTLKDSDDCDELTVVLGAVAALVNRWGRAVEPDSPALLLDAIAMVTTIANLIENRQLRLEMSERGDVLIAEAFAHLGAQKARPRAVVLQ